MLKILVIDDEETRQQWFSERLASLGHTVWAAQTSVEAYRLLRDYKFDLAFFDHDLGEDDTGSTIASHILYQPDEFQCPSAVWVHSLNEEGAKNIESKFKSVGVPTWRLDYLSFKVLPLRVFGNLKLFTAG